LRHHERELRADPSQPRIRIFNLEDGKIVEHWDVRRFPKVPERQNDVLAEFGKPRDLGNWRVSAIRIRLPNARNPPVETVKLTSETDDGTDASRPNPDVRDRVPSR
jgi:hypothetical protein